ncbi:hypothetical protein OF83DRAFT_169536 [Amylostereum chailletii]|nr:hypothetical protein OF83DRAFT_169536 [Amylostereum chailletii]
MERYHFMLLSEGAAASDIRSDHNTSGAHGPSHYLPAISGTDNGQQEFINYSTIDFGKVPELTLYDALAHTAVQDAPPFLPPPDFSDNLQSLFDDISTLRATMSSIGPGILDAAPSTVNDAQSQITHIPSGGQYTFATGYNYTESNQLANLGTTYAHHVPSALAVDSANQALLLSQNHHVQGYTPSVHPSVPIYDPEPAQPYCANEISSAYETQSHYLRPHTPELDAFVTHDVYNDTMVGSFHRSLSTSIGFEGPFWGAQSQGYQPLNQPSFLGAYPGGLPSRDPTTTDGASYTENFVDPRLLGGPEGIVNGYQPATGYIPDDHYESPRDPIEHPLQFELTGRATFTCDPIDPTPSFRSSVGELLDQRQSQEVSPPATLDEQDSGRYHGRSDEQHYPSLNNVETPPVFGSHYTTYGLPTPHSATFCDSSFGYNPSNEPTPLPMVHVPFASTRLPEQTSRDSPAMASTGMITPPSSAGIPESSILLPSRCIRIRRMFLS